MIFRLKLLLLFTSSLSGEGIFLTERPPQQEESHLMRNMLIGGVFLAGGYCAYKYLPKFLESTTENVEGKKNPSTHAEMNKLPQEPKDFTPREALYEELMEDCKKVDNVARNASDSHKNMKEKKLKDRLTSIEHTIVDIYNWAEKSIIKATTHKGAQADDKTEEYHIIGEVKASFKTHEQDLTENRIKNYRDQIQKLESYIHKYKNQISGKES